MTVQVGDTFKTDSNTYTVLAINGRTARVRYGKPRGEWVGAKGKANYPAGTVFRGNLGNIADVWEGDMNVAILGDMDRVGCK